MKSEYIKKICPYCNGRGYIFNYNKCGMKECGKCDGPGYILIKNPDYMESEAHECFGSN
jgi:DnaJ-class molecular chaperone